MSIATGNLDVETVRMFLLAFESFRLKQDDARRREIVAWLDEEFDFSAQELAQGDDWLRSNGLV